MCGRGPFAALIDLEVTMHLSEPTRAYIYRVLVAVSVLAVAYGRIAAAEVPLWLELASAVLGLGSLLAAGNTSTVTEAGQLVRTDNGPRPGDGAQP